MELYEMVAKDHALYNKAHSEFRDWLDSVAGGFAANADIAYDVGEMQTALESLQVGRQRF